MTKVDKLIELNNLEKQNRRNRLEDKLKQQEYYGEIEELFDPLTKTISENNERNLALSEQTLGAIDWQNQELDKQTKMIGETASQIEQAGSQFNETASKMGETASQIGETLKGTIKQTQDIAPVYVDTKTAKLLHDMGAQTNPQLKLELVDLSSRRYKLNGVDITLEQGAFLVRDNVYEFSEGFTDFLTKTSVTYDDKFEEDENKIKRFLKDIRYDLGKGDKKSARYRTIKRIMEVRDDIFGRKLNGNPNNLVERLELLILETKAGHDGLYDEMLDISKQLLSMNIIDQDQLDNFVFNYGKPIMMEKQQQQLAKEVFSPQITKFKRQRIIPLYKDETWSADLIDKSSLSNYNNNYKFILTVIDIFTKYAWAIPLKNKSGLSITNGFKTILSEGRKPEKLWVDRGSEFYNQTFKSLLKEYGTGKTASGIELYSTYSDLKAVFIERFNRTLLHIINKPMFINGDGNWVNILNDAVVTYNNNIHSTINMTPVDASNNPDKVKYTFSFKNIKPKLKVGDYVRNVDKRNIFSEGYTSNWNRELFKINEVLNTHLPTYKIEDINGEIIEGKYYEQKLSKSEFDFKSNNKVLESLNIFLKINNDKNKKQI